MKKIHTIDCFYCVDFVESPKNLTTVHCFIEVEPTIGKVHEIGGNDTQAIFY